jgi:hypothetical protein
MESNFLPDLSPEHSYAHKIAAKELAKYCEEFARWRTAQRASAGLASSPQKREIRLPRLNEKPGSLEPRSQA